MGAPYGLPDAFLPSPSPGIPAGMTLRTVLTDSGNDAHHDNIAHKADAILMRMGLDPMRLSDGLSGGVPPRIAGKGNLYAT